MKEEQNQRAGNAEYSAPADGQTAPLSDIFS
jgi:hypothetical protein